MGRKGGGERFTLIFPDPLFFSFNGRRVRVESRSASLRRPRYSTQASCSGAEPKNVVHPGRRSIGMLLVHQDLEHAGGNGAELCWKQQSTDVQVSVRNEKGIGCGECAFTLLSRVSRRSWVVTFNIFRRSDHIQSGVNELIVRLMQHSSPSHSSTP